jgi:5-methylcytosine-specific restriction endonuclease McrA
VSWFKKPRWESKRYLEYVRTKSCMHCYAPPPSEAHHWHPHEKGVGRKPSDAFCVSLCRTCHQHFHDTGTLPNLSAEMTRSDFVREQWRMMGDWICGEAEETF